MSGAERVPGQRPSGVEATIIADPGSAIAPAGSMRSGYRVAQPREAPNRPGVATFVLVRLTGLLLAVLVLGHFALTHIVNDVGDTNAAFVARRWGSVLWVTWDCLMLAAAITHGAAGLWIAIDDYTSLLTARRRRRRVLLGISALALALGTLTIVAAEV
jgi:succinate dehydrogenase hydrophobic anchor subunit